MCQLIPPRRYPPATAIDAAAAVAGVVGDGDGGGGGEGGGATAAVLVTFRDAATTRYGRCSFNQGSIKRTCYAYSVGERLMS